MKVKQEQEKITALYERLSRDDEQVGDSNSIKTQKTMLEAFAEQHGYTNIVHYTDDGYGGGAFETDSANGDEALFNSGRALFATIGLNQTSEISRELDSFSVLPCPKYNTAQADYVTSLTGSIVFGIMKTAKDPVMSATVLEALSILTYEDVRPVYYDKGLKLRYSADGDTAKMVDLIVSKINVDFAFINSSNFEAIADKPFDMIAAQNRNYVSGMKKYVDAFEQNLENFYDAYSDKTSTDSDTSETTSAGE